MQYIHHSPLEFHGNLRSTNVVVDNRWMCKITDFGLRKLRSADRQLSVKDESFYFSKIRLTLYNLTIYCNHPK